jgi:hypothetical protein
MISDMSTGVLMKISNLIIGALVGAMLASFFLSRHHNDRIEEANAIYAETIERMSSSYQIQIDQLQDVDEACTELFERNMELEVAVVVLNTKLLQSEMNCLRRLHKAKNVGD